MTNEDFLKVAAKIKEIISGSQFEGHVFFVGGCCRDMVLGHPIKDIDIVVDIPDGGIRFAEWLYENKLLVHKPVVYPVYSTAMFTLSAFPDIELEAVQTRKEMYTDPTNRNPVTAYGTIKEDCYRRDFTTNTLYMDMGGSIIDITGHGISDIKDGIIRTPLEPNETFCDDPLRILRAIRFASRYNWKIDSKTMSGMKVNVERLNIISRERIADELKKMLSCEHPCYALEKIAEIGAVKHIFGMYDKPYEQIKKTEQNFLNLIEDLRIHETNDWLFNFTMMLMGSFVSMLDIEDAIKSLKLSNEEKNYIVSLRNATYRLCEIEIELNREGEIDPEDLMYNATYRKFIRSCKREKILNDSILIHDTYIAPDNARKQFFDELIKSDKEKYCVDWFTYQLPVSGDDVMTVMNIKPGKRVRTVLDDLMNAVYGNPALTKEDMLEILLNYK